MTKSYTRVRIRAIERYVISVREKMHCRGAFLQELLRQNRANWLVAALLQQRYPHLFTSDAVNESPDDIINQPFEKLLCVLKID